MTSNSTNADLVDPRGPVFISYRHSDGKELAENLAWGLRAAGVPVWHDQTDLPPGDTENRLMEALSSGISGAVLLVTPEVTNSTVVREVELPRLLELEKNPAFTFAVGSTVEHPSDAGSLDYSAPDQLLGQEQGTLQGLHQARIANMRESAALANAMCRRRMEALRPDIERASGLLRLDVQTRVPPYAMATEGDLVLHLRPPIEGDRRPHAGGLHDLHRFLGQLPQLVAIAGASAVQVCGGAHLSVACAIGAALPTTLLGKIDVIDNQGGTWTLTGQAPTPTAERQCESVKPPTYVSKSGPVLVYVDLLPQRSDAAFEAFSQLRSDFAGIAHLRHRQKGLLVPKQAAAIVGELSSDIRSLANAHNTTEIHLLLRCPYPIALLLGRTLNTLTAHLYEWEDSPKDCPSPSPRYIPSFILRPGAGGSPIYSVTAPPVVGLT